MNNTTINKPRYIQSQYPLDIKLWVKNIMDLMDLGVNNEKAFTYYSGMFAYDMNSDIVYRWVEWNPLGSTIGLIPGGFTYPACHINDLHDYSNKTYNFVQTNIGLVNEEDYDEAVWAKIGLNGMFGNVTDAMGVGFNHFHFLDNYTLELEINTLLTDHDSYYFRGNELQSIDLHINKNITSKNIYFEDLNIYFDADGITPLIFNANLKCKNISLTFINDYSFTPGVMHSIGFLKIILGNTNATHTIGNISLSGYFIDVTIVNSDEFQEGTISLQNCIILKYIEIGVTRVEPITYVMDYCNINDIQLLPFTNDTPNIYGGHTYLNSGVINKACIKMTSSDVTFTNITFNDLYIDNNSIPYYIFDNCIINGLRLVGIGEETSAKRISNCTITPDVSTSHCIGAKLFNNNIILGPNIIFSNHFMTQVTGNIFTSDTLFLNIDNLIITNNIFNNDLIIDVTCLNSTLDNNYVAGTTINNDGTTLYYQKDVSDIIVHDGTNSNVELLARKSQNIIADTGSLIKYASIKAIEDYVKDNLTSVLRYVTVIDASLGFYPTEGSGPGLSILKGDTYIVNVEGTILGLYYQVGDFIIANTNNPGQLLTNWDSVNTNITYIPEDKDNKVDSIPLNTGSTIKYPSVKAIEDYIPISTDTTIYTPTITSIENIDQFLDVVAVYKLSNNTVTIAGNITIVPIDKGLQSIIRLTLPTEVNNNIGNKIVGVISPKKIADCWYLYTPDIRVIDLYCLTQSLVGIGDNTLFFNFNIILA